MKEPLLEPLLRRLRISQVVPYLSQYKDCRLLDIGCGWEARLLKEVEPLIKFGVGIDLKAPDINSEKIKTSAVELFDKLPFKDNSFEFITMLAVLEHIENDAQILEECARVLTPGGGLFITVPSKRAKPLLEFLSYKMKIINELEIRDHKRYYNKTDLIHLVQNVKGLILVRHKYFQLGFNNLVFLRSQSRSAQGSLPSIK